MRFTLKKIVWALTAVSIGGTGLIYPALPFRIPSHWNFHGQIDHYSGKGFVFFTALLPALLSLLAIFLPKIDPRRDSYQKHQKAFDIFMSFFTLFLIALHWVTILAAFKIYTNVRDFVVISLGILFAVIGNYLGQIYPNYTFGIKTPWTLANDLVWTKTHRLGRILFIVDGILFILTGISGNPYGMAVAFGILIVSIVYLFIYSYIEFKKTTQRKPGNK